MFVYEDDSDSTLVLGAGLKDDWIDSPEGISINKMPTYYGDVSYTVKKSQNGYQIKIWGNLEIPEHSIIFKNFKRETPSKVPINGKSIVISDKARIVVNRLPIKITITY